MDDNGYVVGWGTLALINAGLAQTKNRSAGFWFLLSIFLGPVATFLVVVSGTVKPRRRPSGGGGQVEPPGQDIPAQGS